MNLELIIRSNYSDIDFALLKDGKLIELHKEKDDKNFAVGDVFLAKVKKTLNGLNASFVNVGSEKDAFLHYHDLGPKLLSVQKFFKEVQNGRKDYLLKDFKFEKDIDKNGNIEKIIKGGQKIIVQVVKEPISTKGPRISSELSIAGRYLVLVPFSERVSVSQKIGSKKEKERLKRLVKSIKPKGFGVILRTVAEDIKVADLDKDLQNSLERWKTLCAEVAKPNVPVPVKVLSEVTRASSILRDIFSDSFTRILSDDKELVEELKEYIGRIAPKKVSIVKHYKNKLPIFDQFGIEKQIKSAFGRTVSMQKGAYLVIEHTEALHVIDVNSGNRSSKGNSQQDTALEVNLIAAAEVARQLQLRNMGGIIVVDFIDMRSAEHRNKLFEFLKEEMSYGRTKHKILPPTKFGLVQITRQRVREELVISTREPNPNKDGKVEAPILLIDKMEHDLDRLMNHPKYNGLTLNLHPFVAAYIQKGFPSIQHKWMWKYKKRIHIFQRDAYQYLQYRFYDNNGKAIR